MVAWAWVPLFRTGLGPHEKFYRDLDGEYPSRVGSVNSSCKEMQARTEITFIHTNPAMRGFFAMWMNPHSILGNSPMKINTSYCILGVVFVLAV